MTDLRQAAQQALEALEGWEHCDEWVWPVSALEQSKRNTTESLAALRTALEQQQAEPVTWAGYDLDGMVEAFSRVIEAHHSSKHPFHNPIDMDAKMALRILRGFIPAMKAYATPPQRPWVGLTVTTILNMMPSTIPAEYDGPLMEFARAVEAKLKERNT